MIKCHKINKSFGDKQVLSHIDLELDKAKTHVFIGTSGSGKTTLLKVIAGLIAPSSGSIESFGFRDKELKSPDYINQMGYVIQEGGLFPHLSSEQNIFLALKNSKKEKAELLSRYHELLDMVHLTKTQMKKFPHELSGGQRQRVGLVRALIKRPNLLLMDEPLGALDPLVRLDLQNELKEIFEMIKTTVVMVTHDINEAVFFGHTMTLLSQGEIIQHGGFQEFVHKPETGFVTNFIKAQTSEHLVRELAK